MQNKLKTAQEAQAMFEGGQVLATILQELKAATKPGMSTKDLSNIAAKRLKDFKMKPAFLGYHGFPDVICITINEEVQHTIPSPTKIVTDGCIVNLDFGVLHKGLITDAAITYPVGQVSEDALRLIEGTEVALANAISILKPGLSIKQVSAIIQKTLQDYGLGIVRDLIGHGVGTHLHEDPEVPNYKAGSNNYILKAGNTIAIEPIATLGSGQVKFMPDGWNILTTDGSWAAQTEHTILITETGCKVLTKL